MQTENNEPRADTLLAFSLVQGGQTWEKLRSGDSAQDFDLLQRISFHNPEAFWPPVLKHLRIKFHTLPYR